MVQLHTFLRQFDPTLSLAGVKNVPVTGVCEDSRLVEPGNLFIARGGTKTDGKKFVSDAQIKGAVAVVPGEPIPGSPLPQVIVKDIAAAPSILANLFFERPSDKVHVLGVTGTNGKTTTTYLIRHILASVKRKCGLVGTVEIDDGRKRQEASMTTPGAVEIARLLASMRDKGCWSCAIEVSSHALEQGRVAGVRFAGAAFSNLTGDHLDYHKTMDNYAAAKAKLFESLTPAALAAVNAEDAAADRMVRDCKARVLRFGFHVPGKKLDVSAEVLTAMSRGAECIFRGPW